MTRNLRKALRGWKAEFGRIWRKLDTFRRIAFAGAIAIAAVYMTQRMLLEPIQKELNEARQQRGNLVLPPGFTNPQEDHEVRQARQAAQELEQRLMQDMQRLAELQTGPEVVTRDLQADVLARLDGVIHRHGLMDYSRRAVEDHNVQAPVPVHVYHYRVSGAFPQLHAFLHDLTRFPFRSQFDRFELRAVAPTGGSGTRRENILELDFRCILYFAE